MVGEAVRSKAKVKVSASMGGGAETKNSLQKRISNMEQTVLEIYSDKVVEGLMGGYLS